ARAARPADRRALARAAALQGDARHRRPRRGAAPPPRPSRAHAAAAHVPRAALGRGEQGGQVMLRAIARVTLCAAIAAAAPGCGSQTYLPQGFVNPENTANATGP